MCVRTHGCVFKCVCMCVCVRARVCVYCMRLRVSECLCLVSPLRFFDTKGLLFAQELSLFSRGEKSRTKTQGGLLVVPANFRKRTCSLSKIIRMRNTIC